MAILFLLLSLGPLGHAATCASATMGAVDVTLANLPELIGATISYTAKYAPHDPSDTRTMDGRGVVQSVSLWNRDARPSFSLTYLTVKGDIRGMTFSLTDTTLAIKIKKSSALPDFTKAAKRFGLEVKTLAVDEAENFFADFLRPLSGRPLRLLAIVPTENGKYEAREFDVRSTTVPDAVDTLLLAVQKLPNYAFHTLDGTLRLRLKNIVAIAY